MENDQSLPHPPRPPSFAVESGGDKISLKWEMNRNQSLDLLVITVQIEI